jgi:hypothetical protein
MQYRLGVSNGTKSYFPTPVQTFNYKINCIESVINLPNDYGRNKNKLQQKFSSKK